MLPAQPVYISLNPGKSFRRGDRHHHISLIQAMLQLLSRVYSQFPDLGLTGQFDGPTEEAVRLLQTLSGLPVNGILDKNTWKYLVLHHALAADTLENR